MVSLITRYIRRFNRRRYRMEDPLPRRLGSLQELLDSQTRLMDMILAGQGLAQIMEALALLIERHTGAPCSIMLTDSLQERLLIGASAGLPEEYVRRVHGMEIAPLQGACGTAAYEQRLSIVADAMKDPRCRYYRDLIAIHPQLRSCLAIPCLQGAETFAVIELHREEAGALPAEVLSILQSARRLLELSAERVHFKDEVFFRTYYDEAMSLPNKAYCRNLLQQAMADCARKNGRLAVVYLEIEGLQPARERLGQVAEDELLIRIAEMLQGGLPEGAELCRMGDGEFALLLKDGTEREAARLAAKLTALFKQPLAFMDHVFYFTANAGIGLFPEAGDTVLQQAKSAMYRAKRSITKPSGSGAI
ncbi:diguanylate cyclase domain-containing protein [Paenibacillus macerans]|uniref:GGDEF domain-containing protein n=1 Tax=Paenibacillus macerans TaxID=44252 RepID=UPI003D317E73